MENVIFVSLRMIHVQNSAIVLIKVSQCYVPSMVNDAIIRILDKMTTSLTQAKLLQCCLIFSVQYMLKHKLSSTPFIFSISNKLFMRTLLRHFSELGQTRVFVKTFFSNKFYMVPFNQCYLSNLLLTTCRCINYEGLFCLLNSLALVFASFLICQLIRQGFQELLNVELSRMDKGGLLKGFKLTIPLIA